MVAKIGLVAGLVLVLGVGAHVAEQARPEAGMARAAGDFLKTLDDAQRAKATFAFDSEERFNWHFIPRERKGLPLKEMTAAQRDAAFALLKTGLSASGFSRAETIRSLELVLRAMENRNSRDPEMYFFSIFGNPGDASWAWRYEGHHAAQNWTIARGKAVATSPAFFGANPAEVMDGPQKGTRAITAEGDLAWALLDGLVGRSREVAIVSATAPTEIVTGNSRKAAVQENSGVLVREMSAKERGLFMALLDAHIHTQAPALAAERLARIKAAGIENIRFAWMGAIKRAPGAAHYYRIQGPTFLIEYDNVQNNANHQHVVWRDFKGDFGDDLLAMHYAAFPHQR
ncbi:MAG TPA: DUF3500 domain-containing protein [Vicinamibacterales bacterium]|nr:DUF3500 domain-containing protein [Vicinamibacterales bacterium]